MTACEICADIVSGTLQCVLRECISAAFVKVMFDCTKIYKAIAVVRATFVEILESCNTCRDCGGWFKYARALGGCAAVCAEVASVGCCSM